MGVRFSLGEEVKEVLFVLRKRLRSPTSSQLQKIAFMCSLIMAPWILVRSRKLVPLQLKETQQIVVGILLLLLAALAELDRGRGWLI